MKKNFFKKLASVTALALVVTSVAPSMATTAAAAKAPSLNVTSKTLYVGKKFDINVKNKPSTTVTYTWSSDNKTVATVAKGGIVTAKKSGKATIKLVIKNKKTSKTVKTLKATFTVKESATSVKISNPIETVGVGEAVYDFNRTLTTKSGGKATDKTYWVITDDTAGATVDANGVVSTTKTGEFKIQAVTATSKANFEAGKTTAVSEVLTVKVPVAVAGVKQTTVNKVQVTFNTDVTKLVTKADLAIENVATHSNVGVKEVTFSADGKVATVETFVNFADAKEYSLTYAKKATTFTASQGAVASVVLNTQNVVFNKETELKYTLLDANGIDVTAVQDLARVTVDVDTTTGYKTTNGFVTSLLLFAKGNTAKVTVTYHTYKYENNAEVTYKAEGVVTAVDATAITYGNYDNYTIAKTEPDWTKLTENNTKLAIKDTGYKVFVKATDSSNKTITSSSITYTSANDNVLLVSANGDLTAVKEGTTYVIANIDGKPVWTLPVTVVAERAASAVMIKDSKNTVTLSNAATADDKQTVEVIVKDQFGSDMSAGTVTVDSKTTGAPTYVVDGAKVTFAGKNVKKGTYTYVLTASGKSISVVVNVVEANAALTSNYQMKLSTNAVDTVIKADTLLSDKDVVISVGEYKDSVLYSNNVNVTDVKVTKDGKDQAVTVSGSSATFHAATVSGGAIVKAATGTYLVTVKVEGSDKVVREIRQTFTITDTQAAAYLAKVDKLTSKSTGKVAVANDALTIKAANGTELQVVDADVVLLTGAVEGSYVAGNKVFIKEVTVLETIGNHTVKHVVAVGQTITIE